jgi:hypothetical protein
LRLTVLLLPEEAYNYPDDPDWHGVSVLQVDPRGDEEGLRSSRWSNPLGVVTTRAAGRPPTDNTQWRWVALSETVNDRRLTYERSTDSRDWRWASSAR